MRSERLAADPAHDVHRTIEHGDVVQVVTGLEAGRRRRPFDRAAVDVDEQATAARERMPAEHEDAPAERHRPRGGTAAARASP